MPIYEYHCEKCGHEFEVLQKHFDVDEMPCESCGAKAKRMISNTTFVLKGTGWYVTDYKKGNSTCPSGGNGKPHHGEKPAADAAPCASAGQGSSCSSCPSATSTPAASSAGSASS